MKQEQKYDIFISYRRDGGEVTARILRDSLTELGYNVFFDVESLRSGAFNTKLYSVIDECKDFILILSPGALDRCKNQDDWVRREIEYALEKKKNVIPILLRNFEFPTDLPVTMKDLPFQSGLAANLEYYDAFIEKLQEFLTTQKPLTQRFAEVFRKIKLVPALLATAVLLAGIIFGIVWLQKYPITRSQINLTSSVVSNVSYNLTCMDILANAQQDMLDAAEDCLLTGEADICASRFAVCYQTFTQTDCALGEPSAELLAQLQKSPFAPNDLQAMHTTLTTFRDECLRILSYLEYVASEECMLTTSEKRETISLYRSYLEETVQWFAYCANEMLLPVSREAHLETFWKETLPYLSVIPLEAKDWNYDKDALVEAGNKCYETIQGIESKLNGILAESTMALREEQTKVRKQLTDAGYTEARAEKIVSYMSRDWEAELTENYIRKGHTEAEAASLAKEEAQQKKWELDVMLTFSAKLTDDMNIVWEKMTYLLDLGFYEEAEECISLYQSQMTNSDRYMPALVLFLQMCEAEKLDHGIMVMEYYEEDGINKDLMIGDIIYELNGEPVTSFADYTAKKQALTAQTYTVKLLRLDESYEIQVLDVTLDIDAPRVWLNDLIASPQA